MDRQTVLAEPLRQYTQHAASVRFTGKTHDKVVRITYQEGATLETRLHHFLEPHVQHIVQVNVGQERRDHSPLRRPGLGVSEFSSFKNARLQPLVDQT